MTAINLTSYKSITNSSVSTKRAEDAGAFKDASKVKTLSKDDQTSILSKYVSNFDQSFSAVQVQSDDAGEHYYFEKENEEEGTKEFFRVVEEDGETKVIHTTVKDGTDEGQTELFEINKEDEFDAWNQGYDIDENGNVEDFSMFEFNPSTYSKDLKDFAQKYINKFDKDGDGELNQDEFTEMALDEYTQTALGTDAEQLKSNYDTVSKLISMYQDNVVSKYDKDNDGVINKDEFFELNDVDTSKITDEERKNWDEAFERFNISAPEEDDNTISAREIMYNDSLNTSLKDKINTINTKYSMYKSIESNFNELNIDGKKENATISAKEFASMLYTTDVDWDSYSQDPEREAGNHIDGKINFINYNSLPGKENFEEQMKYFYNQFYEK